MRASLFILVLILIIQSCNSQVKTVEEIYQDCYFNSLPNNGDELKRITRKYEEALIKAGVLKDNSSKSYHNLFKKVFIPGFVEDKTRFSFIDTINTLSYKDLIFSNVKCTNEIKVLPNYNDSRSYILGKKLDSVLNDYDLHPENVESILLKFYKESDFNLDYYRLRVLLMIPQNIPLFEKEKVYSEEQIKSSLKLVLNKKNEVLITGKKIKLDNLRSILKDYLKNNNNQPLIIISTERDLIYADYLEFFQKFNTLKHELLKKYSFEVTEKLIE